MSETTAQERTIAMSCVSCGRVLLLPLSMLQGMILAVEAQGASHRQAIITCDDCRAVVRTIDPKASVLSEQELKKIGRPQ